MLSNLSLKFAGLAFGLMLVVGCQHQGAGPSSDAANVKKPAEVSAATPAQRSQSSQQQSTEQAEQTLITVHLAQMKAEPELLTVDLGEDKKLYALPQPIFNQEDIQGVTPVTTKDGKTFIIFDMTEQGRAKLSEVSTRAKGHFFLISVKRQLIGVARIDQPMTEGQLVMATENAEHARQVLQLMR